MGLTLGRHNFMPEEPGGAIARLFSLRD